MLKPGALNSLGIIGTVFKTFDTIAPYKKTSLSKFKQKLVISDKTSVNSDINLLRKS